MPLSETIEPDRRRARSWRRRRKGSFLLLLLWWRRHELDGILDGLVYAGMVGIGFAFVENILYLAAAYNGTDATGPGGTSALTGDLRPALPGQPVRPPAVHLVHRHRGGHRGCELGAPVVRLLAPLCGYVLAVLAHALWNVSTLGGLEGFVGVYLRPDGSPRSSPSASSPSVARRSERRMLLAALDDAAQRGLLPASDIPWLVDLGARRAGPRVRQGARRRRRREGDARVPAGRPSSSASSTTVTSAAPHPTTTPCGARRTSPRSARCVPTSPSPDSWCPRDDRPDHRPSRPPDDTAMLTALVRLRGALQDGPAAARAARRRRAAGPTVTELVDQLEDYVLPRLMTIDAPLLTVVGGSTGAGKSTLVNSLVGRKVSEPGVLRPTTRSPVLVHNPDDAEWFGQDRLLPDLERVTPPPPTTRRALQLVPSETVPAGLAILDAPDIDSVEERNRTLAAQLLAAADMWLFVTSAARYADQVPWDFLRKAAERSAAVAIVLDRTPVDAVETVSTHLARMLASRGLKDSPLFTVPEAEVDDDGLLAPAEVADIRGWLESLAADAEARAGVVKQTLEGAVRTVARQHPRASPTPPPRRSQAESAAPRGRRQGLRRRARQRREGLRRRHPAARRGARPLAGVRRHRRAAAVAGDPGRLAARPGRQRGQGQAAAGRAGHRRRRVRPRDAAARARRGRGRAGRGVVAVARRRARPCSPTPARTSAARRVTSAAAPSATVRDWQQGVLEMVRTEGADKRGDRAVPRLRRQRAVGRADDRGLRAHRRHHRRRGRDRRRQRRTRPEAAGGGLRRPGRAQPRRARPARPRAARPRAPRSRAARATSTSSTALGHRRPAPPTTLRNAARA